MEKRRTKTVYSKLERINVFLQQAAAASSSCS
jgi:hypothetical protein